MSQSAVAVLDFAPLLININNMPHLKRLDLSDTRMITWTGLLRLLNTLSMRQPRLRTLNLAGTMTDPQSDPIPDIEELQHALQKMHSLHELNLSDNRFCDAVAFAVGTALAALLELRMLSMTHNKLDVPGVGALIAGGAHIACLLVLSQERTFDRYWNSTRTTQQIPGVA